MTTTTVTTAARAAIISMIDARTDYDASTITFHRDGSISGKLDADKTGNGPHKGRQLIGYVSDWADRVNPDTTTSNRAAIVAMIDAHTNYDASTITFLRDGAITGKLDADKTGNGPHNTLQIISHVSCFADGANPYTA